MLAWMNSAVGFMPTNGMEKKAQKNNRKVRPTYQHDGDFYAKYDCAEDRINEKNTDCGRCVNAIFSVFLRVRIPLQWIFQEIRSVAKLVRQLARRLTVWVHMHRVELKVLETSPIRTNAVSYFSPL